MKLNGFLPSFLSPPALVNLTNSYFYLRLISRTSSCTSRISHAPLMSSVPSHTIVRDRLSSASSRNHLVPSLSHVFNNSSRPARTFKPRKSPACSYRHTVYPSFEYSDFNNTGDLHHVSITNFSQCSIRSIIYYIPVSSPSSTREC